MLINWTNYVKIKIYQLMSVPERKRHEDSNAESMVVSNLNAKDPTESNYVSNVWQRNK